MFGRRAPIEIEIGAGKGEFIIERAAEFPDCNFIAVELSATITRVLAATRLRGTDNLRVVRMDARTLVNLMLPDASVSRIPYLLSLFVAEGTPHQASTVHADSRREPLSHSPEPGADCLRCD